MYHILINIVSLIYHYMNENCRERQIDGGKEGREEGEEMTIQTS
jgi:hypothetical protein